MASYDVFARAVALVGGGAIQWRRLQGAVRAAAVGGTPDSRPHGRRAACRR